MTAEQQMQIFPKLNQYISLDEDMSSEVYYSLVLAYNDKIYNDKYPELKRGKKMNSLKQEVYVLADDERDALEMAFKSGRNGVFNEEDIAQKFAKLCGPKVREVVSSKLTQKEKLALLHKIAVEDYMQNPNCGSYKTYDKVAHLSSVCEDNKDAFLQECKMLDTLGEMLGNPERLKASARSADEINKIIDAQRTRALERVFTYAKQSVGCVVMADAYQQKQIQLSPVEA